MLPTRVGEHCAKTKRLSVCGPRRNRPRHINCLEMLGVCQACQFFLPDIRGHHVLVRSDSRSMVSSIKSPGQPRLEVTLHAGERPSCVGPEQSTLAEGRRMCRAKWTKEKTCCRGTTSLRKNGHSRFRKFGNIWQGSSRPLCLQRQLSLPNLFYKEHGCPGPRMPQPSALCPPPNRSATAGTQASQGTTAQASFNSPLWRKQPWVSELFQLLIAAPCVNPLETGPPALKRMAWYGIHGPSYGPCMWAARRKPFQLSSSTIKFTWHL